MTKTALFDDKAKVGTDDSDVFVVEAQPLALLDAVEEGDVVEAIVADHAAQGHGHGIRLSDAIDLLEFDLHRNDRQEPRDLLH